MEQLAVPMLCVGICTLCHASETHRSTGVVPELVARATVAGVLVRLCLVLAAVQLARVCYRQLRMYLATRNLPRPWLTLPVLGNILQLISVPQEDVMGIAMEERNRLGPTYGIWVGPNLCTVCTQPQDLRVIFTHEHLQNKGSVYSATIPILGKGLINLDLPEYQCHRKAVTASLHVETIKSFIPRFAAHAQKLASALELLSQSGEVIDAVPFCVRYVCDSVCDTILGLAMDTFQSDCDRLREAIHPGSQLIIYLGMRPWFLRSSLCFRLLAPGQYRLHEYCSTTLHDMVVRFVEWRQERLQREQPGEAEDLLGHVLTSEEGAQLTTVELIQDLKHVIVGAIATDADLLACLMLCLALEPHVQDRVHQELDEVFADDPCRPVTAEDLPSLRYLDMTMKEVLRYFPLIPIMLRSVTEDVTLPSGHVLPQGSMALILPKLVHWDPRWYPEPSTFNPDRFLPEVAQARPNFSFIPFSAGVRSCPGQKYALLSAKTMAATFLREYRFLPAPGGLQRLSDAKLSVGVALKVHGGVHVRVQRRCHR